MSNSPSPTRSPIKIHVFQHRCHSIESECRLDGAAEAYGAAESCARGRVCNRQSGSGTAAGAAEIGQYRRTCVRMSIHVQHAATGRQRQDAGSGRAEGHGGSREGERGNRRPGLIERRARRRDAETAAGSDVRRGSGQSRVAQTWPGSIQTACNKRARSSCPDATHCSPRAECHNMQEKGPCVIYYPQSALSHTSRSCPLLPGRPCLPMTHPPPHRPAPARRRVPLDLVVGLS